MRAFCFSDNVHTLVEVKKEIVRSEDFDCCVHCVLGEISRGGG